MSTIETLVHVSCMLTFHLYAFHTLSCCCCLPYRVYFPHTLPNTLPDRFTVRYRVPKRGRFYISNQLDFPRFAELDSCSITRSVFCRYAVTLTLGTVHLSMLPLAIWLLYWQCASGDRTYSSLHQACKRHTAHKPRRSSLTNDCASMRMSPVGLENALCKSRAKPGKAVC